MAYCAEHFCVPDAIENVDTEAAVESEVIGHDSGNAKLVPHKWRGTTQDQFDMSTIGRLQQLRVGLRSSLSPRRQSHSSKHALPPASNYTFQQPADIHLTFLTFHSVTLTS